MPHAVLKNNISMYYDISYKSGNSEYLFLIPGLTSNSLAFSYIIPRLYRTFNVISVDNRGVGRTIYGKMNFSIEDMAEDIIMLMDYLEIERADFLGHSMGGYIAQVIAASYPHRIRKMVLSCSSTGLSVAGKKILQNLYNDRSSGKISFREFNRIILKYFTSPLIYEDDFMREAMLDFMDNNPYKQLIDGFKSQVEACKNFNMGNKLGRIKTETLVITGEIDSIATIDDAIELNSGIEDSALKVLKGAGHLPYIEKTSEYVDTVLEFLN
ncbi:MAG: alpha/beta hydrolase [Victivallales bacterium]|nr:alpha/beta hydrolase [Victivallales bacterium]